MDVKLSATKLTTHIRNRISELKWKQNELKEIPHEDAQYMAITTELQMLLDKIVLGEFDVKPEQNVD